MITEKFPYQKLSRSNEDGSRKYLTPDGSKLASVTTILADTAPEEDKLALQNWRKSVGQAKATEISVAASSRGTRMHSYLEGYVETGELKVPGSIPQAKLSNDMAKVIIDNGFRHVDEIYGSEISLWFPHLYAGTTDLVMQYKGDLAIGDYKQTNKLKTDNRVVSYKIQLAAYILAHDELYNTSIKQGIILMCSQNLEFQSWEVSGVELEKYKNEWWRRVEKFYKLDQPCT